MKRKNWILTLKIIASPHLTEQQLEDKETLQCAFDDWYGALRIEIVAASVQGVEQ